VVEIAEHAFCLVEAADQKKTPDFNISRIRGILLIAMLLERRSCCRQRPCRPIQIARNERDLRFRHSATGTGDDLLRAKGAGRTPHESPGATKVAELRHGDAAKGERWRVVTQGNTVQCPERITCGKRASGSRDQRIPPHLSLLNLHGRP
jgi:hypothetical protein